MSNKISPKQLIANKNNAKKGGVKTEEGKLVSSKNALRHGCLSQQVLPEEFELYQNLYDELVIEMKPENILERVLVERIAGHILQLNRVSFSKNEFVNACANPGKFKDLFEDMVPNQIVTVEEPYKPKIKHGDVKVLLELYHRYEISVENRFYKAIREYRSLRH